MGAEGGSGGRIYRGGLMYVAAARLSFYIDPPLTASPLVVAFHTRFSYWFSNGVGTVKLLTLIFIAITGLVVLGGHTSVAKPTANFENSFDGRATPYGLTNALYKVIFSYAG